MTWGLLRSLGAYLGLIGTFDKASTRSKYVYLSMKYAYLNMKYAYLNMKYTYLNMKHVYLNMKYDILT